MTGLTDFITEARWEDTFTLWYIVVDDAYQALEAHLGRWRRRGPAPTFSDSEVITVALIIDTWFGGDEAKGLAFLRQYHLDLFPQLLAAGPFNERRRTLRLVIEQVRRYLLISFGLIEDKDELRFIDSLPVPVCAYGRAARNQTVAGPEYVGYHACNNARFFGFRLQATVTHGQVVDEWMLAPAGRKDGKMMPALLEDRHDLVIFGDNAYLTPAEQDQLRRSRQILVYAMPRKHASQPWPQAFRDLVKRIRLRIETAFSVLTTVFHVHQPGSRSLAGVIARTSTRLLAHTLCFITAPLFATGDL